MDGRINRRSVDLARHVRPGDMVVWGQSSSEPNTLTSALLEDRHRIGGFRCFVGAPAPGTGVGMDNTDGVTLFSYTGSGVNGALIERGSLDVIPCHYSQLPATLSAGPLAADVVLLRVPTPDRHGRTTMGWANEYLSAAIDHARAVLVEVDDSLPRVGGRVLDVRNLTAVVPSESATPLLESRAPSTIELAVAEHVAALVEDGSTLQFGVGSLPDTIAGRLSDHRRLGIHSGVIGDGVARLIASGAADNSRKQRDTGTSVAGVVMGSSAVLEFLSEYPDLQLRETEYTHAPGVLAAVGKFVSVNSAVEVDLTGQVNAEVASGRYLGSVGGAIDFARGARASTGGLAIIALPSMTRGRSRIVSQLSGPVSTSRADAAVFVTEYGVADLRGRNLRGREDAMIAIAHPDHRDTLSQHRGRPSPPTEGPTP